MNIYFKGATVLLLVATSTYHAELHRVWIRSDIFGVSEVFFTLRKFGCNNNSRHHLPKRVCQRLGRLDSLGFHSNGSCNMCPLSSAGYK